MAENKDADEHYIFVQAANYASHVNALKASHVVSGVLPSYDAPVPISPSELASFEESAEQDRLVRLYEGDIVSVTSGYLCGLKGLVVGESWGRAGFYDVFFRFCTRSFTEAVSLGALEYEGSLFDIVRSPVTKLPEDGVIRRPVRLSDVCIRDVLDSEGAKVIQYHGDARRPVRQLSDLEWCTGFRGLQCCCGTSGVM